MNLSFSLLSSFHVLVAQSCPTLCDPMDYSPPGSFVRGIPQARIRFLCFPAKQPGRAPSESDKCCWAPAVPACLRRLTSRVLTTAGLLPVQAARLPVQEPDREARSRQTGLAGWGPALSSCDYNRREGKCGPRFFLIRHGLAVSVKSLIDIYDK